MKKTIFLLTASMLFTRILWAQPAQLQVNLHLQTTAAAFAGPLKGYQVVIWEYNSNGSGTGISYYTDNNGNLNMNLTSAYNSTSGRFKFEVKDCQNQLVATQQVSYNSSGAQVSLADSVVVGCIDPCNVGAHISTNGNEYNFYAFARNSQRWNMANAQWDFSDGTSYVGQNIKKSLPLGGTNWFLTHQGCVVDSGFINVTGTCNAHFSVDTAASTNGTVKMYNNSTGTSSANTLHYFWDLGDGNTSTLPFPQHQYLGNGPYSIYLNVTEVDPLGDTICSSWYGDTLGIDSAGNVYKSGIALNVVNPAVLSVNEEEAVFFNLFPQPAHKALRITGNTTLKAAVLLDLNGRIIQEWALEDTKEAELLLKKHRAGLYVLQIQSSKGFSNHKCLIK